MPETALDQTDLRIIKALQQDAGQTNAELAERVGLSPSPCLRRVRMLERAGVLNRRVALVDPARLDLAVNVFVRVTLERQIEENLAAFEKTVQNRPEVVECYLMTGEADYLLRIVARDLAAYHDFLLKHLTRIPGVSNIQSSFALNQVKYSTALPLDHLSEGL